MSPFPRSALLVGAAFALTACGGTAAPPRASDQPPVTLINGRVATWSGAGSVRVPGVPAAPAPVGADGTFTLTLPGEAALAGRTTPAVAVLSSLGCSGTLTGSLPDARAFLLAGLSAQDTGGGTREIGAVTGTRPGPLSRRVLLRAWLYADAATALRGTLDCARLLNVPQLAALPVTVAVDTRPGWNVVDLDIAASANLLGQLSASGTAVNSAAGTAQTVWRTLPELQAQLGF